MAIKLDGNPNNDAQVGGNVVTNVGNPATTKPVVASVAPTVVSMVPKNDAPVAAKPVAPVTVTAPSAAYPASGPQSPSSAPVGVALNNPNGTGTAGGNYKNEDGKKPEPPKEQPVVNTPVVEKQPEPVKPVVPVAPGPKVTTDDKDKPVPETNTPSSTPANITLETPNTIGKTTGSYDNKDPNNGEKPKTETTPEPKTPGGGGDDSSTKDEPKPKDPVDPIIPVVPTPKQPVTKKRDDALTGAVLSTNTGSMNALATDLMKNAEATSSHSLNAAAFGINGPAGSGGGVMLNGAFGKKIDNDTYAAMVGSVGIAQQGGQQTTLAGVGAQVGRKISDSTLVSIDANVAYNSKPINTDTATAAKLSGSVDIGANHRVNDNVSVYGAGGVVHSRFADGSKDTYGQLKAGVNYDAGKYNLGLDARASKIGQSVALRVGTKTVNSDLEDVPISHLMTRPITQKEETQQFTGEFRSHFEFNKSDLQMHKKWDEVLDVFGSTRLLNGNSPLKEAVEKGLPFIITASTDQYGDAVKAKGNHIGNQALSEKRAGAAQSYIFEQIEANPEKFGLTKDEVPKLKALTEIRAIGESQAMQLPELREKAKQHAAERGITLKESQMNAYIQEHISVKDRYVGAMIDTKGRTDVMLASKNTVEAADLRISNAGGTVYKGNVQTVEHVIGMDEQKVDLGRVKVNKKGDVVSAYDNEGNKLEGTAREGLIQQYNAQKATPNNANPNNFDADALQKAINTNNAIEAQKAAPTQPTLEHNSQTMRPM